MPYSTLITEVRGSTLLVTINRPDALNALNATVLEELDEVIRELNDQADLKGAIITGAGDRAFVAGADIAGLNAIVDHETALSQGKTGQGVFDRIEQSAKPIVAAVNGFALGGGCELAMACHLRVASAGARFGQPEVNLGLIPGYGGTQRLPRLIGATKATELILTGDMIGAEDALGFGLVNAVVDDSLIETCESMLEKIYSKSPLAVGLALKAIQTGVLTPAEGMNTEAELFAQTLMSNDGKEGTKAFLEKRPANFRGD